MAHEMRPDEIERRERALRMPTEGALTGAVRDRLGLGLKSSGTPIQQRTVMDAAPRHIRSQLPEPAAGAQNAAGPIREALRANLPTNLQKAAESQADSAADAARIAKGVREITSRDPGLRLTWALHLAERHAAMTAGRR